MSLKSLEDLMKLTTQELEEEINSFEDGDRVKKLFLRFLVGTFWCGSDEMTKESSNRLNKVFTLEQYDEIEQLFDTLEKNSSSESTSKPKDEEYKPQSVAYEAPIVHPPVVSSVEHPSYTYQPPPSENSYQSNSSDDSKVRMPVYVPRSGYSTSYQPQPTRVKPGSKPKSGSYDVKSRSVSSIPVPQASVLINSSSEPLDESIHFDIPESSPADQEVDIFDMERYSFFYHLLEPYYRDLELLLRTAILIQYLYDYNLTQRERFQEIVNIQNGGKEYVDSRYDMFSFDEMVIKWYHHFNLPDKDFDILIERYRGHQAEFFKRVYKKYVDKTFEKHDQELWF